MKILVRLPNWLGDMVMSVGMMHQLPQFFPGAEISVIAKKGIHELLDFFPPLAYRFVFSKDQYKGLAGLKAFGKLIRETESFDLYVCLPNSFSAAYMGFATGASKRVGYKKELRQLLLTDAYKKPTGIHRALEYTRLVELYTGKQFSIPDVSLHHSFVKTDHVVVNINSEAESRRLTVHKAVELLDTLRQTISERIILVGAPREKDFVDGVINGLKDTSGIENRAGATSLTGLAEILASAKLMISTDSGPAHLANALGTHTIILFGAGNEKHTAPFRENLRNVIRLGELSCEPCERNICARFGTPQCLERLDTGKIVQTAKLHLS